MCFFIFMSDTRKQNMGPCVQGIKRKQKTDVTAKCHLMEYEQTHALISEFYDYQKAPQIST